MRIESTRAVDAETTAVVFDNGEELLVKGSNEQIAALLLQSQQEREADANVIAHAEALSAQVANLPATANIKPAQLAQLRAALAARAEILGKE